MTSKKNTQPMDKAERRANETLKEFIRYSSSPWRIIWTNFVAGLFRGLGTIIGASVFIAFIIWVLTLFVDVPLIGEYAVQIKDKVVNYVETSNYDDEFRRIEQTLENIEGELQEVKEEPTSDYSDK
ncbi:MAG: Unknown protein [uncultured Thiotrichaceae bacterium]|uniref:Uncharacterized protein n=1 Tax=uncultured Thiotrichaceae bacterium TaxID=298394 RepID=A0A6S6U4Z9_9GAMM|nr:MAG: Unknown protein [uncultured Thiotrichaceae bacterium]